MDEPFEIVRSVFQPLHFVDENVDVDVMGAFEVARCQVFDIVVLNGFYHSGLLYYRSLCCTHR